MEWISVNERMPENNISGLSSSVLIYDGCYVDVGHYDYEENEFKAYGKFINREVITHWMPLPEPTNN